MTEDPFIAHRNLLFTVAYEMLGSAADAEDVLQESWLRWADVDQSQVNDPRAYLIRIVTRQALNQMRTLSRRREDYVGEWLPEPLLTTPIRREELLIGKATAALIPAVGVAYVILGAFLVIVQSFADPLVASTVWHAPELLGEIFFIPLLGGWAIWVGLAISSKVSEVRVAQQLGILASFPPIALIALMSFAVVTPTLGLAVVLGGVLLVIDCGAYLFVSQLFDRERLVTGTRPRRDLTGTAP